MFIALDRNNERVDIENAIKENAYYCPICKGELVQKKGSINVHHFAHKSLKDCDKWYEMTDWHKDWQEKFEEQYREVIITDGEKKHRADIKYYDKVIEFQHSSLSQKDFLERTEFYSQNNKLIWVFDVRGKDITQTLKKGENNGKTTYKTDHFLWKHAYRYNIDIYNLREYYDVDIYFQVDNDSLVKVVWAKKGFKYFGGYSYEKDKFLNYIKRRVVY